MPDQKFIYILWQSQTFCARQKDDLHSVKLVFEEALNAVKFLGWHKIFGPAPNILGPVKGRGISTFSTYTFWYGFHPFEFVVLPKDGFLHELRSL